MAFTEDTHPGRIAFNAEQERQQRYRDARTPEGFAELLSSDPHQTDGMRTLLREYQANPDAYELRGGTLQRRKNSFLQFMVNNPWTIPLTVIGGSALGAAATGGGAGAAAAGGSVPTLASGPGVAGLGSATGGLVTGVPGAMSSGAAAAGLGAPVSAGIGGARGAASILGGTRAATGGGMGFLGRLGGWLNNAGKVADVAGGIGRVASNAARGSADQRMAENSQELQAAIAAQNAALQNSRFEQDERREAQRRAILSALIGNIQDVNVGGLGERLQSRVPTISGGLRPSALTGGGSREALVRLLDQPSLTPPTFTAPSTQAGAGEKGLGLGGLILSLLGAARNPGTEGAQ